MDTTHITTLKSASYNFQMIWFFSNCQLFAKEKNQLYIYQVAWMLLKGGRKIY